VCDGDGDGVDGEPDGADFDGLIEAPTGWLPPPAVADPVQPVAAATIATAAAVTSGLGPPVCLMASMVGRRPQSRPGRFAALGYGHRRLVDIVAARTAGS